MLEAPVVGTHDPDYYQQRHCVERHQRQLVRRLERLGHKVTLEPIGLA
jgi:hypothetical protein